MVVAIITIIMEQSNMQIFLLHPFAFQHHQFKGVELLGNNQYRLQIPFKNWILQKDKRFLEGKKKTKKEVLNIFCFCNLEFPINQMWVNWRVNVYFNSNNRIIWFIRWWPSCIWWYIFDKLISFTLINFKS